MVCRKEVHKSLFQGRLPADKARCAAALASYYHRSDKLVSTHKASVRCRFSAIVVPGGNEQLAE